MTVPKPARVTTPYVVSITKGKHFVIAIYNQSILPKSKTSFCRRKEALQ